MKSSNDRGYNFMGAVISDIHGNSWALKAVLKDIERRGINNIMNLGDCLYGPLDPAGTADMLISLNIPTVRGNEDRIVVEVSGAGKPSPTLSYVRESLKQVHLQWLKSLPLTYVAYEDFFLFHGTPYKDDEYGLVNVSAEGVSLKNSGKLMAVLSSYPQQVFLCGHDHIPRIVYLPDGKMIIDAGSVGLPAYTDDFPFPHAMETYTPHARYSIIYKVEKDKIYILLVIDGRRNIEEVLFDRLSRINEERD